LSYHIVFENILARFKRFGVLITRMGNEVYSGVSTIAMFDVVTRERILFFRPAWPYRISAVLVNDPEILADPVLKQKAIDSGSKGNTKIMEKTTFSDEEIVEGVAKYICYGVKWKSSEGSQQEWKGLNVIVP